MMILSNKIYGLWKKDDFRYWNLFWFSYFGSFYMKWKVSNILEFYGIFFVDYNIERICVYFFILEFFILN